MLEVLHHSESDFERERERETERFTLTSVDRLLLKSEFEI
jgi:hypothetical protein